MSTPHTDPTHGPTPTRRLEEAPTMTAPHPDRTVKVPHLVLALLFLGLAAGWALVITGALTLGALPYALPGLLVAAGVVGLVAVAAGRRRSSSRAPAHQSTHQPADQAPATMDEHDLDETDPSDDLTDDLEHTAPLHRPEETR